ncbi:MAG TPA: DUF2884 family protein [Mizugakiibacter sp.]
MRFAIALLILLGGVAAAHADDDMFRDCHVNSAYALSIEADGLHFVRSDGTPHEVAMNHGRLRIDGRDVSLAPNDAARIAEYEATVRTLAPQSAAIAGETLDVVARALDGAEAGFVRAGSSRYRAFHEELDARTAAERAQLDGWMTAHPWDFGAINASTDRLTAAIEPRLQHDIIRGAIWTWLLHGERGLDRRSDDAEDKALQGVRTQVQQLEGRAQALCLMTRRLDRIEQGLNLSAAGVPALDLLHAEAPARAAAPASR